MLLRVLLSMVLEMPTELESTTLQTVHAFSDISPLPEIEFEASGEQPPRHLPVKQDLDLSIFQSPQNLERSALVSLVR